MKNLVPISIASLLFLGIATNASARTMPAAHGHPATASQAGCFPSVWNGAVTNSCSSRIYYEVDLITDNDNLKSGVQGCFNDANIPTGNLQAYWNCWLAAYQPSSGYYTSPGAVQINWGPNPSCVGLSFYGLSLPSNGNAYATCYMPQNLQWFNVIYNP
jgi:hypothetical protein